MTEEDRHRFLELAALAQSSVDSIGKLIEQRRDLIVALGLDPHTTSLNDMFAEIARLRAAAAPSTPERDNG